MKLIAPINIQICDPISPYRRNCVDLAGLIVMCYIVIDYVLLMLLQHSVIPLMDLTPQRIAANHPPQVSL